MVVTWVTLNSTALSVVEYGQKDLDSVANGVEDTFVDGGSEARKIYMHRVTLSNLLPNTRYREHGKLRRKWSVFIKLL